MILAEGDEIVVDIGDGRTAAMTVVEIKLGKVRLGFSAPAGVPVMRSELLKYGRTYQRRELAS